MQNFEVHAMGTPVAPARRDAARILPWWLDLALRQCWRFPLLLRRVAAGGERELLLHRGRVVGALIPAAELERLRELDRRAAAERE